MLGTNFGTRTVYITSYILPRRTTDRLLPMLVTMLLHQSGTVASGTLGLRGEGAWADSMKIEGVVSDLPSTQSTKGPVPYLETIGAICCAAFSQAGQVLG